MQKKQCSESFSFEVTPGQMLHLCLSCNLYWGHWPNATIQSLCPWISIGFHSS